jgi:hypothetical protein
MKLTLSGHDDRYAVEQLQLSLFPEGTEGEAISSLHRGKTWLTATAKITINGKTAKAWWKKENGRICDTFTIQTQRYWIIFSKTGKNQF